MDWYVVKTKPKKEEVVSHQLSGAAIETFLPKMRGLGARGYREQAVGKPIAPDPLPLASCPFSFKPLFPSYLFVRTYMGDPKIYQLVRYTRGVSHLLGNEDGPVPIEANIVDELKARTLDGSLIEQELLLKEGDSVRVKRGILRDLIGIIEKNISAEGRVKVLFRWLSASMKAKLQYTDLERIN